MHSAAVTEPDESQTIQTPVTVPRNGAPSVPGAEAPATSDEYEVLSRLSFFELQVQLVVVARSHC